MKDKGIKMRQPQAMRIVKAIIKDWRLYILLLPMVIWFITWAYKPMGGLLIAFKRFDPQYGVWGSEFKGIDNFINLVAGVNKTEFWQAFRNTFIISAYNLILVFRFLLF